MANFIPKKIDLSTINNGNRYVEGDTPNTETFNAPIEASAYVQGLATNVPDTTRASNIGTPNVYIDETGGTPRLVFENLKGEKGDSGISDALLSNEFGDSDTDGYTQKTVNSLLVRPNLLINPDFKINQRGKSAYDTVVSGGEYTVDRWKKSSYASVTPLSNGIKIQFLTGGSGAYLGQAIENGFELYKGKYATMTIKYANGMISSKTGLIPLTLPTSTLSIVGAFTDIVGQAGTSLYLRATGELFAQLGVGADTSNSLEVEWVKVEIGKSATEYVPRLVAEEINLCKRYYQKIEVATTDSIGIATASTNSIGLLLKLPISMRILPSVKTDISNFRITDILEKEIISEQPQESVSISGTISNLVLDINGTWNNGTIYGVTLLSRGYIELDAELYGHT